MHGPEIFLFPLVIIVVVFAFTGVVHWVDSQRKEREAFYRADTLKRFADAPGDGAKQAFDLLREQDRQRRIKASKKGADSSNAAAPSKPKKLKGLGS